MPEYLKPRQHYIDRYDRQTVERCRRFLNHDDAEKDRIATDAKKLKVSEKGLTAFADAVADISIYFYSGDRYVGKEETIDTWMREDEARDTLLETAVAPDNIMCLTCGRLTFVDEKLFRMGFDGELDRVLFFYRCPLKHVPSRAFYNDGEEKKFEEPACPKCGAPVVERDKVTKKRFVTILTCPKCGNIERSVIERTIHKPDEPDSDFEKDRARFCLAEKEGLAYLAAKEQIDHFAKVTDKMTEREKNKDLYDKVAKLKKLKIAELEHMLAPVLEKEGYIKLQFKNPEITKDVFVPFIVYDGKPDRDDRTSTYTLERILRKTLRDTNWRLMSDGTNYRLGMLEGRFHGYEKEEDLVELIRVQDKKEGKKSAL
jgi:predicted RNA-binding Zn-ribbon protein involved in translation (DUF1610 family)